MWNCPHCNCQAIAASLEICPQCQDPREEPEPAWSAAADETPKKGAKVNASGGN